MPSGCQNCITEQHPPCTLMVGNQEISFMELERSLLCWQAHIWLNGQ